MSLAQKTQLYILEVRRAKQARRQHHDWPLLILWAH